MLRNPFALSKMTYNEKTQTVIYRSKQDYHSKCNFKVFSAEDFIAAITQHIPALSAAFKKWLIHGVLKVVYSSDILSLIFK